jgi:uncharacterized protein
VKQLKLSSQRWWLWTRWFGLAYLSANIALFLAQERLLYHPSSQLGTNPSALNVAYQEIQVPVGKTEKMRGWWLSAQGSPRGTVIYFQDLDGNIATKDNVDRAGQFAAAGLNVLMVDYRGYGKSGGSYPAEKQLYVDADWIWNYATKERKLNPKQTLIYGHGLGTGLAIYLAQKHPEASGAIVQNSFTSIPDLMGKSWQYKIFPLDLLLTQKFNSGDRVKTLTIPTLYIHGTADKKIPSEMSRTLYNATAAPNKQITMVANGEHDLASPEYQTPQHQETLREFISAALKNNSIDPKLDRAKTKSKK